MDATIQHDDRVAMALSGGGFRATLFHLGSLWRLNELGWLARLSEIRSVSGGSITMGWLASRWDKLAFDEQGVSQSFAQVVAAPLMRFCTQRIDWVPMEVNLLLNMFNIPSGLLASYYDYYLFQGLKLSALPAPGTRTPKFYFLATSLQTGSRVYLSRDVIADSRLGAYPQPKIRLSQAVAASSSFPPVLSPTAIKLDPRLWVSKYKRAASYDDAAYRRRLLLTDGGIYDNLGIDGIWGHNRIILVSDASSPVTPDPAPRLWAAPQGARAVSLIYGQTQSLRKRMLIDYSFLAANPKDKRYGAYWATDSEISNYHLADPMTEDSDLTRAQALVRTRLDPFSDEEQGHLINWGYAMCDTAMRKWVQPMLVPAPAIPSPQWPLPRWPL